MTILCAPQGQLAALPPELAHGLRTVTTLPDLAMAMAHDPAERIVVIGSQIALFPALSFVRHLRRERPYAQVILMRDELDQDTVLQASAAGIEDVVPANEPYLLSEALERAALPYPEEPEEEPEPSEPLPLGRIITVFAAKGGCGKTTIATNLAVALNKNGSRKVCLIDLDLAFGDVAISMQLEPTKSLVDAVSSAGHLDEKVDELVTNYHEGLDCILAPVVPGDAEKIPVSVVEEVLSAVRRRYDYVVIDTPAQFSEHVLAALDASHHHVLLTTAEIPAMKNLRLTLDMLDLLAYRHDARSIVLNRSDARGGLGVGDVEKAIKCAIAAQVPASHDVPASINRGVPIVDALPDHLVSRAIRDFANSVIAGESAIRGRHALRRGLKRKKEPA